MRFAGTFVLLVLGSVGATAGLTCMAPAGSATQLGIAADAERVLATLPDPASRRAAARSAEALASPVQATVGRLIPPRVGPAARGFVLSVAVRSRVALRIAPLFAAAMLIGVAAGLARRHRLREQQGFASLTFSYLGKQAVAFALAVYFFTALSPLGPPAWGFYLAALVAALGACIYVGNLPPKL